MTPLPQQEGDAGGATERKISTEKEGEGEVSDLKITVTFANTAIAIQNFPKELFRFGAALQDVEKVRSEDIWCYNFVCEQGPGLSKQYDLQILLFWQMGVSVLENEADGSLIRLTKLTPLTTIATCFLIVSL